MRLHPSRRLGGRKVIVGLLLLLLSIYIKKDVYVIKSVDSKTISAIIMKIGSIYIFSRRIYTLPIDVLTTRWRYNVPTSVSFNRLLQKLEVGENPPLNPPRGC